MCTERSIQPALFGVTIQFNSSHCGLQLSAIKIPERCALLGLVRQGQIIPMSENPIVFDGDFILAIALHPMFVPAFKLALKQARLM